MGGDNDSKSDRKKSDSQPVKEVKRLPYSCERTAKLIKEAGQKLPEKVSLFRALVVNVSVRHRLVDITHPHQP